MDNREHHILNLDGQTGRLYYYQGNFFHPLDLVGANIGIVKGAVRKFLRDNRAMVDSDRADPAYRTPMQLMDATP
jgi:hypothetical protein